MASAWGSSWGDAWGDSWGGSSVVADAATLPGRHLDDDGYTDDALIRKVIQHHEDLSALRQAEIQIPATKSPITPEVAQQPAEAQAIGAPAPEPRVVFVPVKLAQRVVTVRAPGRVEEAKAPTDRVMTEEEMLTWILLADE